MLVDDRPSSHSHPRGKARVALATGGTEGNSRLTGATAAVLLVLLAVEGLTLLSLQTFLSWHIFVGMLLRAGRHSEGRKYRLPLRAVLRRSPRLRANGGTPNRPPPARSDRDRLDRRAFRVGVTLAAVGPGGGIVLGLHQASFIVWFAAMSSTCSRT